MSTATKFVALSTKTPNRLPRETLLDLLTHKGCAKLHLDGEPVYLDSVQREDGSGHSFNLRVCSLVNQRATTVYVRVSPE